MYHERALKIEKTTSPPELSGSISFSLQQPVFGVSKYQPRFPPFCFLQHQFDLHYKA